MVKKTFNTAFWISKGLDNWCHAEERKETSDDVGWWRWQDVNYCSVYTKVFPWISWMISVRWAQRSSSFIFLSLSTLPHTILFVYISTTFHLVLPSLFSFHRMTDKEERLTRQNPQENLLTQTWLDGRHSHRHPCWCLDNLNRKKSNLKMDMKRTEKENAKLTSCRLSWRLLNESTTRKKNLERIRQLSRPRRCLVLTARGIQVWKQASGLCPYHRQTDEDEEKWVEWAF